MSRVNPVVLVLVAIASVQLGAAMAKGVFDTASPGVLALTRVALASVVFLAIARPRFTGRSARDWLVALGYGVCLVGMNVAIYYSFARIPIGVAVTVEFIGPLALAVLGSRRPVDLVWVGFAAAGVLLLGALPSSADLLGLLLALVAGAFWAGYIVLAGPLGRRWEGISGVAAGSMLGTLLLAAPVLLTADGGIGTPGVWLTMAAAAGSRLIRMPKVDAVIERRGPVRLDGAGGAARMGGVARDGVRDRGLGRRHSDSKEEKWPRNHPARPR